MEEFKEDIVKSQTELKQKVEEEFSKFWETWQIFINELDTFEDTVEKKLQEAELAKGKRKNKNQETEKDLRMDADKDIDVCTKEEKRERFENIVQDDQYEIHYTARMDLIGFQWTERQLVDQYVYADMDIGLYKREEIRGKLENFVQYWQNKNLYIRKMDLNDSQRIGKQSPNKRWRRKRKRKKRQLLNVCCFDTKD